MQDMTPNQREEFIDERIRHILTTFDEFHHDIAALDAPGRDEYIQSRLTRDLAITDSIMLKLRAYVLLRDSTWRWIMFVDVIALVAFIALVVNDLKDIVAFVLIASVMVASRVLNRNLLAQLHKLLELYESHAHRESNTAALLFLVNAISIVERVKVAANGKPNDAT